MGITFLTEEDAVAGDNDVAGIAGERTEDTADGAGEFFAGGVAADLDVESDEADDTATAAGAFVDDAKELIAFGTDADHGASAEEITASSDSFGERCIGGGVLVIEQLVGEVLLARTGLAVAAQVNADFAALG
jgi:hypothetical protein